MEAQVELGFVTQLGISNLHDVRRFERIYEEAAVKPRVLQNRFSPQLGHDAEIRLFCQKHGVVYQPFWVLSANGQQLQLPVHKSNIAALPLYPTHCMICAQEIAGRDGGGPRAPRRALCGSQPVRRAHDNSSLSHFPAMTLPSWLCRAARNRHCHAIEQASRR